MDAHTVSVTEIADEVFRVAVALGVTGEVSCFVIRGEEPALVETGLGKTFPLVRGAVADLVDISAIRHIFVPYFAPDECGALNDFLAEAPHAHPVCSPPGAISYLDFCDRPPLVMADGDRLTVSGKSILAISAPWVPAWDSMLFFDETDGVLFSSDLFIQPRHDEAMTEADLTANMVAFYEELGALPSSRMLESVLGRLEALDVRVIAAMHGPTLLGDPRRYYAALRDNPVTDLLDAPHYSRRLEFGPPART